VELRKRRLTNNQLLLVREAVAEDAGAILQYIEAISGESDYLSFGRGEFKLSESEERRVLLDYQRSDNNLYALGLLDDEIVGSLSFSAGSRPRIKHTGEFGMSVRKEYWGLGIGSALIDTLVDWARATRIIFKINLRVRTDNQRAIQLYERKGFVREGTISKEILLDGKYYDHHWMGLEL
jgi:RimJ/RimL family protein N-acetyltransferase